MEQTIPTAAARPAEEAAAVVRQACELAVAYLASLPARPVGERAALAELRARLAAALPETGEAAETVLRELAAGADPGLVASAGPRYFGFVIGGSVPAGLGAGWLARTWGPHSRRFPPSPAAPRGGAMP